MSNNTGMSNPTTFSRAAGVLCVILGGIFGGAVAESSPPATPPPLQASAPDTALTNPPPSAVPLAVEPDPRGQDILIEDGKATLWAVGATVIPVWAGVKLAG